MEMRRNILKLSFVFIITFHSHLITLSHSKTIIKTLPGYAGDLPFKLETGYIEVGKKNNVQLFYYFVESTRNPEEDPLIFFIPGGPGACAFVTFFNALGPLNFVTDNSQDNFTLKLNPAAWTQMASIIFVDIPVGAGFSYADSKKGWISSDNIMTSQAIEFIKKFLNDHSMFFKNPLYISGISYAGIVVPKITLELYEGNERGDQPPLNIQGYILINPLTDKFKDFNSRVEYTHRMALISDDIYKSALKYCYDNYVDIDKANSLCAESLHQYEECTILINVDNILEPFCNDTISICGPKYYQVAASWANDEAVQEALKIRKGKVGRIEMINHTLHYLQGKNDTFFYSYDIFSSFHFHKKLSSRNCRSLIISGDHDMTFPYVGVEQWIASLNLGVEIPWKPFYVDGQVGGYKMKYVQNHYSLTYATVKGSGHLVPYYKPKETVVLTKGWLSSQIYSSDA